MKIIKDHAKFHPYIDMILVFGLLFTLLGSPRVPAAQALGTIKIGLLAEQSERMTQVNTFTFINCAGQTQLPETECEALVAFYNSTNGANWIDNTGWLQTNTPCGWYGVSCVDGHVMQLSLWGNGLFGRIPPELGNLMQLTYLELGNNQLTGTIPPELGSLANLNLLNLPDNQLSGSIPAELSALMNLNYLSLTSNRLTGTIPPELGNLTNLDYLSLGENQLTGHIPAELGKLTNLTRLALYYNQLTGTIPPELGNLTNLKVLDLSLNQLTGSIPVELGSLTSLTYLEITSNQLIGGIPKQLESLTNLQHLRLYHNQLTGGIPVELGTLTKLESLMLDGNRLTGGIPAELGNLTKLTFLGLSNNQLTGRIPVQLGNLTNLGYLDLSYNKLGGEIPTSITNLISLYNLRLSCGLTSTDPGVINFIATLIPGWQNSICPVVSSITRGNPNPTHLPSVNFMVTFSESVDGVTVDDFDLYTTGVTGAGIIDMRGSGTTYTVMVNTGIGAGTIRLDLVDDNTILDAVGNPLGGVNVGDGDFRSGDTYTIKGFNPISQWTSDFNYSVQGWQVSKHPRILGDVNGDGQEDLVGFFDDGVWVGLSNGNGFDAMSKWSTNFSYSQGWRADQHPRTVGDVNGDGQADLIGFGYDGVWVSLSTGSGFGPISKWSSNFIYNQGWRIAQHPRMAADVNGDGKADLIGFGNDGVWIALSNGSGFDPYSKLSSNFTYNQGWRVDQHPRLAADVNGDGKADLIGFGNTGVWVTLSTGSGFGASSMWTSDFNYAIQGWRVEQHPRTVADVNGDGQADLIGFGNTGVWIAVSNGSKFEPISMWTDDFNYSFQGWRVEQHPRLAGDATGDGKSDMVGFGNYGVWVATVK